MISAQELRNKYLEFFKSKGHKIISGASLIPENDPSILFTTAGMHPLVPYLLGEKHAEGNRLADIQKCIRTNDIDNVGDSTHNTFFEMCGNWSLGDYFKKESISWSFEFLTSKDYLGLDIDNLAFTVFKGDENAPFDEESFNIWKSLGISERRIAKLGKKDNWWELSSLNSPAGPDSEIFYWTGEGVAPEIFDPEDDNWVEIWNNVFMEYKKGEREYTELEQKNVDTGLGLVRVLSVLNKLGDSYKTELYWPLIKRIEEKSGRIYEKNKKEMRILSDHLKASVFILGDDKGISPSNTDQGYVLRRLLRRAIVNQDKLGISDKKFLKELAQVVLDIYKDNYKELERNKHFIFSEIEKEQDKFEKTLLAGAKKIDQIKYLIDGESAFNIFQSFGYPVEMTKEIAKEKGINLSDKFEEEYNEASKKHQELSKTASAGKFKGGLSGGDKETIKLHTAAHLLLASLRKVLGDHVVQRGSNITPERLRFDFSHSEKMTDEEKIEVENLVNEAIKENYLVSCEEMDLSKAREIGAMGIFDSKYEEKVKVYTIGNDKDVFSKEICGGPHVGKTGMLGKFKIKKEQSSSSGVRRIKAVLE